MKREDTIGGQRDLAKVPPNVSAIGGARSLSKILVPCFWMLDHILQPRNVGWRVLQRVRVRATSLDAAATLLRFRRRHRHRHRRRHRPNQNHLKGIRWVGNWNGTNRNEGRFCFAWVEWATNFDFESDSLCDKNDLNSERENGRRMTATTCVECQVKFNHFPFPYATGKQRWPSPKSTSLFIKKYY